MDDLAGAFLDHVEVFQADELRYNCPEKSGDTEGEINNFGLFYDWECQMIYTMWQTPPKRSQFGEILLGCLLPIENNTELKSTN